MVNKVYQYEVLIISTALDVESAAVFTFITEISRFCEVISSFVTFAVLVL